MTIVEVILVVAIVTIIGASTTPFISNFIARNNHETTVDKLVSSIRKAQNYSMNGRDGVIWGICLSGNNIRLYRGSCVSPTFSENFSVPGTVTLTGLNDTTFSSLRGEPNGSLNITITSNLGSNTIIVNSAGGIDVN